MHRSAVIFIIISLFLFSPALPAEDGFKPSFGLEKNLNTSQKSGEKPADDRMENWDGSQKQTVKVEQSSPVGPKFKGSIFAKHRSKFSTMCKAIRLDGRSDAISALLEINAYKDEACLACRPLLKAIASACKPQKITQSKEDQEAGKIPEGPKKQREPNLAVIDAVSQLFSKLAEENQDKPQIDDILKAMHKLELILVEPEGKTAAELEYYRTIMQYAYKPFEKIEKARIKAAQKDPSISIRGENKASVDDLFN